MKPNLMEQDPNLKHKHEDNREHCIPESAPNREYKTMFPVSKIKSQMKEESNIGKVWTTAVEKVGAASAIFIKNLVNQSLNVNENVEDADRGNFCDTVNGNGNSNGSRSNTRMCILLTKEKLEAMLQNEEYNFLDINLDSKALSKYGKAKRKPKKRTKAEVAPVSASSSGKKENTRTGSGTDTKKRQKVLDDDVANALLPLKDEDKDENDNNYRKKKVDIHGGLKLDELVKEGDYSNGIILDDEDYD